MKKTLISLVVGIGLASNAIADDLLQVYQQAIENDPIVNRAKANRDAAYEGITISRANLLPQISADIGYSISTRDNTNAITDPDTEQFLGFAVFENESESLSMGADLRMSLYDHANWLGLDRAELVAQQSEASYSAELQRLISRTVQAYLAVLTDLLFRLSFIKNTFKGCLLKQTRFRFTLIFLTYFCKYNYSLRLYLGLNW